MIVSVVVELKKMSVDKPFDYMVDLSMSEKIRIGSRVVVPFGNQSLEGFVINIKDESDDALKYIKNVYDDYLTEEQLLIAAHLRKNNLATTIEAINTVLPPALRASIKNSDLSKIKQVKHVKLVDNEYLLDDKNKELIEILSVHDDISLKEAKNFASEYTIKKLRELNVIEVFLKDVYRSSNIISESKLYDEPSVDQLEVINNVIDSNNNFHLIFGQTGSGKTVCYIELIKHYIALNKNVIILVPEISLTPQYINILEHHINEEIAIFHSKMSSLEKYDQYRKVKNNDVKIALGTRSAVFLPFDNLGLIIIDEEHDDSYLQEGIISYSAKNIASLRSKHHNAKIVLGSATPLVTSYYSALNNEIELHHLKSFNKMVPITKLIDMRTNFDWIIANELIAEIKEVVSRKEQFIVLLNRRGYANYVICNDCNSAVVCPNCDVTLKYHNDGSFKCHHCNYIEKNLVCNCGSTDFKEQGFGIQKVEEIITEKLPEVKITRIDTDIVSSGKKVAQIFDDFHDQKYDGLIGTQILSKGLNFLNVSLVAIIDADFMLTIDNYMSSEKTFQYINQSLGRNLRGNIQNCTNIIQTFDTTHYAIKNALDNDYLSFYHNEIAFRKQMGYPPFSNMTKIMAVGVNFYELQDYMNSVYNEAKKVCDSTSKPHFSYIERINNQYQLQILVKHSKKSEISVIINKIRLIYRKNIKVYINSNPSNI